MTLVDVSRLLRTRAVSPVELTEAYLARIAASDGQLHAYLAVYADAALEQARSAEAAIAAGDRRGELHGVPIALKDVFDIAGTPTTAHSALRKDAVAAEDAVAAARLRAAGAIFLGKLAAWEFAIGGTSFDLPWPPARNPWDPEREPGGSSSGSAVAVAAGLCAGSLGTDTGGSIREPAAWCGIAGLKPTYGLLSRRGVVPVSFSLDHVGPMCRTSADCALMLDALAAPHGGTAAPYSDAIGAGIGGLRIGVVDVQGMAVEPEIAAGLDAALRCLADRGCSLRPVHLAPLGVYGAVCGVLAAAEAFALHEDDLRRSPWGYGALSRQRLRSGAVLRARDYVNALGERARLVRQMADLMVDVDILVMPMRCDFPPLLGAHDTHSGQPSLSRPFNVTGNPALSVCGGVSRAGLPFGIQVVGRPFADALVLRVGAALEEARPAVRPPLPPVAADTPRVPAPARPDREAIEALEADLVRAGELLASRRTASDDPPDIFRP